MSATRPPAEQFRKRLRQEPVVDLMAALEASLTAAKAARQKQAEEADAATPTPSTTSPE